MATYDRFLDIHLTASTNWYDFAPDIYAAGAYKTGKTELLNNNLRVFCNPQYSMRAAAVLPAQYLPSEIPNTGFIACALRINELTKDTENFTNYYSRLVEWVSDPNHTGKIRFNSHGNRGGYVFMHTSGDKLNVTSSDAGSLVLFLVNCGLKKLWFEKWRESYRTKGEHHGISTIALNSCYGARSFTTVTEQNREQFHESAVDKVINALRQFDFHGVKVTGCSTTMANSTATSDQLGNLLWPAWKASKNAGDLQQVREAVLEYLDVDWSFANMMSNKYQPLKMRIGTANNDEELKQIFTEIYVHEREARMQNLQGGMSGATPGNTWQKFSTLRKVSQWPSPLQNNNVQPQILDEAIKLTKVS